MTAKKTIKRVVLIIVGIIVVIIIAMGIFISRFDINKHKPLIEEKISAAVGYNLKIDGDLGLALFPSVSVEVKNLHLENPDKFKAQAADFAYVEKAKVGLALLPLLSKRLEFKDIILNGVSLNLVKPQKGAPNWDLNANKKQADGVAEDSIATPNNATEAQSGDSHAKIAALLHSLAFNEISVKNTTVKYYDLTADKTQTFDNINFSCGPFDNVDKPFKFNLSARMNNTPLSVKGQLNSIQSLLDGAVPFNVDVSFAKLNAKVEGRFAAASDPMLEATASLPAFSPKELMKTLTLTVPEIIAQSGPNAFSKLETTQTVTMNQKKVIAFSGPFAFDQTGGTLSGSFNDGVIRVKITGDKLSPGQYMPSQAMLQKLTLATLTADAALNKGVIDAAFSGNFTLDGSSGKVSGTYNNKGDIHNVTANLEGGDINLDTLLADMPKSVSSGASNTGGAAKSAPATAKKPLLDPATFNKLNIAAKLKLDKLIFKGLTFSNANLAAKVDRGATNADFSARYGEAPLSGTFSGDLTAQKSSKSLTFKTSALPVAPMLKAFANKNLLTGTLNADLNLTGGGMDIDDFKRSMSGQVTATINKGKINVGLGIPFDRINVDMPFTNGKGDIKTGTMTGSALSVETSGWVSLNNDTLDVIMTPTTAVPIDTMAALVGLSLPQGLTSGISAKVPFRIHGPLNSPKVEWAQSIGTILQNLETESLKQIDLKNVEKNLKQGLEDVESGLEGLFGGKKNTGAKSTTTTETPAASEAVTDETTPPDTQKQKAEPSQKDSLEGAVKDTADQLQKIFGK